MRLRPRALALFALVATLAFAPVQAGENEVFVRIVQVRGSGERKEKKAEIDKALEPLRAHLEKASNHAHYTALGKSSVKKGAWGKSTSFDLEKNLRAEVTATSLPEKKIQLVLKVSKHDAKKDELAFETTLEMKDGATAVPQIEKVLEGGDTLLLAITASRDSL